MCGLFLQRHKILRLFQIFLAKHASKGTKLDVSKLLLGHHGAKVFTL